MARSFRRSVVLGMATSVSCLLGAHVAAAQWSIQSVPALPGGGTVDGVSCVSDSGCVAVGQRFGGYGHGPGAALVEYWNGSRWSDALLRKPQAASLLGVSCLSPTACVAVGYNENRHGAHALVERWNGSHWKVQPNPASALHDSQLFGVSCVSRTSCTAVGNVPRPGRGTQALVERFSGDRWVRQPNPASARRHSELSGVYCRSRSFCLAVGRVSRGPLIESWNGRAWGIQRGGAGAIAGLLGVSCASAVSCVAVGDATTRGNELPFAEGWDGSMWSIDSGASPSQTMGSLNGVSCPSGNACTVVGSGPLAERWDGSSWSVQTVPTPSGMGPELLGVSCSSTSRCIAVGDYVGHGYKAGARPLVEMWRG